MYQLLLIEDQSLVRESLTCLLNSTGSFRVNHAVGSVSEAQSLLRQPHAFDLILCDFNLKNETAIKLLQQHPSGERPPVVLLTSLFNAMELQQCLSLGARGFLYKESETQEFIAAITTVIQGGTYFVTPDYLANEMSGCLDSSDLDVNLTASELETLQWLATGMSNKQIAITVGKSSETVKTHVARILQKLQCKTRTQAVSKATLLNLISAS